MKHIKIFPDASTMFLFSGFSPDSYSTFSCHLSLVSFNLKWFHCLSCLSGTSVFCPEDCSSICIHLDFPLVQSQAAHSCSSTTKMKPCSCQCITSRGTCLSTDDGNLDHLSKCVSVIFLQFKVLIFPLQLKGVLKKNTQTMSLSCSSNLYLPG